MSRMDARASLVVVFAGICAALHVAKLPPALPVLQQALGLDLVQAGFLLSAVQVAGMCLGLLAGLGADSLGLRRSMIVGLWLVSLASAGGAVASSVTAMLVLRTLEGLGFLLTVTPAPSATPRVRPARSHPPDTTTRTAIRSRPRPAARATRPRHCPQACTRPTSPCVTASARRPRCGE